MTRYLVDTNHASAVYRRQLDLCQHKKHRSGDTFGIATPAVGELWFMVFNSSRAVENIPGMVAVIAQYETWDFDQTAASEFGRIKADLRRKGRPIQDVDVQIAAIARVNDLTLLTDDADF